MHPTTSGVDWTFWNQI